MLNKLHALMGLKDNVSDLEARKGEMIAVYTMYASLLLITVLVAVVG